MAALRTSPVGLHILTQRPLITNNILHHRLCLQRPLHTAQARHMADMVIQQVLSRRLKGPHLTCSPICNYQVRTMNRSTIVE